MADEFQLFTNEGQAGKGFAEKIRILFAETGIKYKEIAVDAAGLEKLKKEGTVSFGVLPVLKHGANVIEQSGNILEYVADVADQRKLGVAGNQYTGKDLNERYHHRAHTYASLELYTVGQLWLGKEGAPANFLSETVPRWFTYFQSILAANDDGDVRTEEFSYGKCFTFGDVALFEVVNAITRVHGTVALRAFPKLKEFHDKIAVRPRIDKYLSLRQ
eukprot:m.66268 g.66268  ORF g.66268 m.66268 type:complete len:217 (+) comp49869_c0_seq1:209-859(+)